MKSKILVVDDTADNIQILNELLGSKYDVLCAIDGEFAIEVVNDNNPDLILLDIMMPGIGGFEVCKYLKNNIDTKDIPIIFITSKNDEISIENAYNIGGSDYITKPFRPKELLAKVNKELVLQEIQKELKYLSTIDPMTKLYNRRYFDQSANILINLNKRNQCDVCIMMIDIDKFKDVNDIHGHAIGDSVIVSLADELKKVTRNSDLIFRWGGEEFLILLPHTKLEGANIIAEKIRNSAEQLIININNKKSINFTVSIGLTQCDANYDFNKSIIHSDEALYCAKNSGRNKVCSK